MRIAIGVSIVAALTMAMLVAALFTVKRWGVQEVVVASDVYGVVGPASIEEMTARSKVVVRATFVSVRPVAQRRPAGHPSDALKEGYYAALEYTFAVLEYIKGSGGPQITAYAIGTDFEGINDDSAVHSTSKEKAATLAEDLMEVRDRRWESREAILFLRYVEVHDYYWLGVLDLERSYRSVTVSSTEFKAWLPDANIPATTTATKSTHTTPTTGQRFLVEDPGYVLAASQFARGVATRDTRSGEPATPVTPSVSLSDLKARIVEVERRIAQVAQTAPGHSAETYSECIGDLYYEVNRRKAVGWSYYRTDTSILSGKAGVIHTYPIAHVSTPLPVLPEGSGPGHWFEGPDSDLIRIVEPGHAVATRPLPAGVYRVYRLERSAAMAICDVYPESRHDKEHVFTAIAPAGVSVESFFDPYAHGTAVTGTTTVGTISWESGVVEADLTVDVTGHEIEFIDLTGTTTLSLSVDDASEALGVLSWTVATQPWSAGDKLMLRVRRE